MSEKKTIKDPEAEKTVVDYAKETLAARQQAYQQALSGDKNQAAKLVLEDLSRFCRADVSTFHPDARVHAVLEGRREVWIRIHQHLTLDLSQLEKITIKEIRKEV